MGQPVDANGRSILHKGHGMTHTCAVPDVCKTPSPGGPIPIPYVNIAMDSNITDGAESVKIEGNPVANLGAKISTSTGDEPGSAGGGIISSKIKGTVTWKMGSLDVKAEGKSVVRFVDTDFHNGNSFNTTFVAPGFTGMAYGDDFVGKCPICDKDPAEHKILESDNTAERCSAIVKELGERFKAAKSDTEKRKYAKFWNGRWKGYMVGVMICKENPDKKEPSIFAAMSGTSCLSGFKTVATEAGKVHLVIGDGAEGGEERAIKKEDIIGSNTSRGDDGTNLALIARRAKVLDVVKKRWRTVIEDKNYSKYSCAGAHLVARSNHGPMQMTEMYFAPSGHYPLKFSYIVDNVRTPERTFGPNTPRTKDDTSKTPWGETIGSCETCQNLLALTMCPVRTCK
jgi:hypothetical protein